MTCISCTAAIGYVLVRALEHILAALSFISFCSFLCYSIVFLVVFFIDFSHVKINLLLKKKGKKVWNAGHLDEKNYIKHNIFRCLMP